MKDNNLSQALFPGLDFCEPTDDKMVEAAHAWITLISCGGTPLPHGGPTWGTGTVVPGGAIVFGRAITSEIEETYHWRDGRCTAHQFCISLCRVRAQVNVLPRGVRHRDQALRFAMGIARHVLNMNAVEADGLVVDAQAEGGELGS